MIRALLLLHRYLGIVVGVLMLMWCVSGVVMMYVGYPALDPGVRLSRLAPIVWSGWEIGQAIPFPAHAIDHDFAWAQRHPVPEAYQLYNHTPHERPTWDLTSALYAIFPDRDYFTLSGAGKVLVEPDGFTRFTPAKNGRDRFLLVNDAQAARLRGLFAAWCSEPVHTR